MYAYKSLQIQEPEDDRGEYTETLQQHIWKLERNMHVGLDQKICNISLQL